MAINNITNPSAAANAYASMAKTAQAVLGNASLTEIVESVTAAELTLQTVVAVRDKMLQAYQDIMRMPI